MIESCIYRSQNVLTYVLEIVSRKLVFICVFCIYGSIFLAHSGGVMIYFDRIEVVNYLVPSAGTFICTMHTRDL